MELLFFEREKGEFMKRTRKLLSVVLSLLVAIGSMPMLYMVTGAAEDVSAFALDVETGTLENPTRPVEASGVIEREDLYKLNINSQNTSYTFYQTKDNPQKGHNRPHQ